MHCPFIGKLLLALALLSTSLALPGAPTAQAAAKKEITVAAAASLTNAFTTLQKKFEAQHPDVSVHFSFASSNTLLRQMESGAPVDVFASADQATMNQAEAAKLIMPGTRADFVANGLVLIVPKDAKVRPATAQALRDAAVKRIAIGNPDSVPAGRYTRDVLLKAKEWEALSPKYILGQSVRQVLDYVARAEADAGFVYTTDAKIAEDKVSITATMQGHEPILYPIAVLKNSAHPELAKQFVEYVRSPQGQAVLKEYGFTKP